MKKIFLSAAAIFLTTFLCAAEVTVADWDFTKSNVTKNKFAVSLRGKSKITKAGLNIPIGAPKERAGAITAKTYPALTPDGAFSISIDFTLSPQAKRSGKNHVLLDCKYLPAANAKQAAYNYGFMILLKHTKNNIFIPSVAFGYQKSTVVINGKPLAVALNKPHNLRLIYTGKGTVTLQLNKRTIASGKVQTGKVFPSKLPLCFGDRVNADYWPLGGTIRKVTIKKTVVPQKTYRPGTTIAAWSFVNANVQKGKYPVKMRGGKITPAGMVIANQNPNVKCGAIMAKASPDLSPQQGFEITAELILQNTGTKPRTNNAAIFDMKHTPLSYHKGFMFYLEPQPRNRFRMVGAFGFGTHSNKAQSIEFAPTLGKVIKLGMKFTSLGQVIFFYNNKEVSSATVSPGKIVAADIAPAFGDRVDSIYWPLIGTLKSVRIIAR